MKSFFILLFFVPLFSYSQVRDWYSIDGTTTIAQGGKVISGLHLSGNGEVAKNFLLGLGMGAIKFFGEGNVYYPLTAKISFMPHNGQKVSPIILLDGGWAFYRADYRKFYNNNKDTAIVKTKGGPTFYTGVGASFKIGSQNLFYITLGYAYYGFKRQDNLDPGNPQPIFPFLKKNYQGFGLKAGIFLQ